MLQGNSSLCTIPFCMVIIIGNPVIGVIPDEISIDSIDITDSSQQIILSGHVTSKDCKQVGVEIFPLLYWEKAGELARNRQAKGFKLSLLSVVQNINTAKSDSNGDTYGGVFLYIFNPDGTITYLPAPPCPDHQIQFAKVMEKSGKKCWSKSINERKYRYRLSSGTYVVLLWDATNQRIYTDTHIENIYDVIHGFIYPTTGSGLIWDQKNRKKLFSTRIQVKY